MCHTSFKWLLASRFFLVFRGELSQAEGGAETTPPAHIPCRQWVDLRLEMSFQRSKPWRLLALAAAALLVACCNSFVQAPQWRRAKPTDGLAARAMLEEADEATMSPEELMPGGEFGAGWRCRIQVKSNYIEEWSEQVSPGIFIAKTSVRLRSEADAASELTGDMVKVGEVFEVTEVVPPNEEDPLGYLRVGDRGWIFDVGIAGPWVGVPIVAEVTGTTAAKYARILRNPSKYAEYQAALGDDEDFTEQDAPEVSEENEKLWKALQQDIETEELDEEQRKAFEHLCQDEQERNLVLSSLREASGSAFQKLVVPRWMKLAQLLPPEMKMEMEASKQRFSSLPEGPGPSRPMDHGRRMGIRVPSASTAL
eukprot:s1625_g2.t1